MTKKEIAEKFCYSCEYFSGSKCTKGRPLTAPTGCPVGKFKPIGPVGNHPNTCCEKESITKLSDEAIAFRFSKAVAKWIASGMPVVNELEHHERQIKCSACRFKNGHWCGKCACLIKLKTKLKTEKCPIGSW